MSRTVKMLVLTSPGLFPEESTVSVLHFNNHCKEWCVLDSGHLPDKAIVDSRIQVEVLDYNDRTVQIRLPFRSSRFGYVVRVSRESCFS